MILALVAAAVVALTGVGICERIWPYEKRRRRTF